MRTHIKRYKDTVIAIIAIIFAAFYYYLSHRINILEDKFINSTFFPRLLACLLVCLSIVLIIKDFTEKDTKAGDDAVRKAINKSGRIRIILTFVLLIAYVVLMNVLGFPLMTVCYIFAQTLVLTPKEKYSIQRIGLFLCISVLSTAIIYIVFTRCFTLVLPSGIINL